MNKYFITKTAHRTTVAALGLSLFAWPVMAFKPAYVQYGHRMITERVLEGTYSYGAKAVGAPSVRFSNGQVANFVNAIGGRNASIGDIVYGVMSRDDGSAAYHDFLNSTDAPLLNCGGWVANGSYDATLSSTKATPGYMDLGTFCQYQAPEANVTITGDLLANRAHCDDDGIYECSGAIRFFRQQAIDELTKAILSTDGKRAAHVVASRIFLGKALHTLQDFYAHSNFAELHPLSSSIAGPLTAKVGGEWGEISRQSFEAAMRDQGDPLAGNGARCVDTPAEDLLQASTLLRNGGNWDLLTSGVTSGFFNLSGTESIASKGGGCDHGQHDGEVSATRNVSGIAKDTPTGRLAPIDADHLHGYFVVPGTKGAIPDVPDDHYKTDADAAAASSPEHKQASFFAAQHTRIFLEEFADAIRDNAAVRASSVADLSDQMIAAFTGSDAPLPQTVLLVDRTGTAQDIFDSIPASVNNGCAGFINNAFCLLTNYRLAFFDVQAATANSGETVTVTNQIAAGTGQSVLQALKNAKGKGGGDCQEPYYTAAKQLLPSLTQKSTLTIFTDASASDANLADEVEAIAKAKHIKLDFVALGSCSPIDATYFQSTSVTGGRLIAAEPTADGIQNALAALTVTDAQTIAAALAHYEDSTLPAAARNVLVPVDTDATTLRASLNTFGANLKLYAPDGHEVSADAGVQRIITLNTTDIVVPTPRVGLWRMEVTASTPAVGSQYTLSANITGGPRVASQAYRSQQQIGRAMHEYSPLYLGAPPAAPVIVEIKTEGNAAAAKLQFVSRAGEVLSETPMNEVSPHNWEAIATPPTAPYRVRVIGVDSAGKAFERMLPEERAKALTGALLGVTVIEGVTASPGATSRVRLLVQNFGAGGTYTATVGSSPFAATVFRNSTGTLAGQGAVVIEADVTIPTSYSSTNTTPFVVNIVGPLNTANVTVPVSAGAPVVVPVSPLEPIPALSSYALIAMSLLLAGLGLRRRRFGAALKLQNPKES